MSLMRTYRRALGLSQSAFAAQLNVTRETYRPWDAGRREPPPQLLTRARTLAGYPDETVLLPLPVLALMIGVHVRTLHAAARSGRLVVAYETRTTFRRLRPRATLKHALDFRRHYYGTQRRPPATPVPLTWASVPEDYDVQLNALMGLDLRSPPDQVFLRSSLPLPGEIIPEPFLDEEPEVSTIGSIGFRPATRLGEDG